MTRHIAAAVPIGVLLSGPPSPADVERAAPGDADHSGVDQAGALQMGARR